jgi:hypothetical protein
MTTLHPTHVVQRQELHHIYTLPLLEPTTLYSAGAVKLNVVVHSKKKLYIYMNDLTQRGPVPD